MQNEKNQLLLQMSGGGRTHQNWALDFKSQTD